MKIQTNRILETFKLILCLWCQLKVYSQVKLSLRYLNLIQGTIDNRLFEERIMEQEDNGSCKQKFSQQIFNKYIRKVVTRNINKHLYFKGVSLPIANSNRSLRILSINPYLLKNQWVKLCNFRINCNEHISRMKGDNKSKIY